MMEYRDASYIDTTGDRINCWINHPIYGWTPYTVDRDDKDMTVDNNVLFDAMAINNDVEAYVAPPEPTQDELDAVSATNIRLQRKQLLVGLVDPVVNNPLRWAELTSEQQAEITKYRADLLNVTEQSSFPSSVVWPITPTILVP